MKKNIITLEIILAVLISCSLNNPFLPTDNIPPPQRYPVESVTLQGKTKVERYVGETYQCVATVFPDNADDKTVFYESSSVAIAKVDQNSGLVTALSPGQTLITVTTNDGKKTATIEFIVKEREPDYVDVTGIAVSPKNQELYIGENCLLSAIITPDNATNKEISWTSNNESIAKVDNNGTVTAIAEGQVIITATTVNNLSDTAVIEVKRKLNPQVFVTAPNGNEEFTFKTDTTIQWYTIDIDCEYVKIELLNIETGENWVLAESTENKGSFYWYIEKNTGYTVGENYKIKISAIPASENEPVITDESDEVFKLSAARATIDLTAPNDGNYFYLSNTINTDIKWLSTDLDGNVSIYLIKKDGSKIATIAENIPNSGTYRWNLPEDRNSWADGSEYQIKIESVDDETVFDISNITFTLIEVTEPKLTFKSPSGEKLYIGTYNDITWEGVGFTGNVKIELVAEDTSVPNYVIEADTPNDSIYEWFINEDIMENGFNLSTKYRIRITTLNNQIRDSNGNLAGNNGTLTAESEIYLEIILAPNVYFVLDDSSSMNWTNPTRITILKQRMDNAAVALAKNFNIGISGMNRRNRNLLAMKKGHSASEIRESYADLTASGGTPIGEILKEIREYKKYEMSSDIYNEYRRKAVVVITDGSPANLQEAINESSMLADEGIPVFYMGINADSYCSEDLQKMAVAGGSDNPNDPTRNWYPIDEDGQFEAALNEIMYGDLEVSGSMIKLEIDCGTPDIGNSIYFYGDTPRLGSTTSPSSIANLYKATYENGKYYVKIRKQDNVNFSWGVVEATSTNIVKIEKTPLHTSDDTSPAFNGWEVQTIKILVASSLGFNKIHYWNCSDETAYPETTYPGVEMTQSGSDYIFTFSGVTSVELLITRGNNNSDAQKLCPNDMKASAPGTYQVTSSGIFKVN